MFSAAEQTLLMEVYEDYSHIIRKKGNTAAINKARDVAWQNIADRLNASNLSSQRRTGHQVKIKYKNILSNATRKQTASMGTGGGPPPEELTPAEILALGINKGPKIVGIEGGSSSNPVAPEIRAPYVEGIVNHCPYSGDRPSLGITNYAAVCLIVTGDQIILLDPPQVHIEDAAGTQVDPGEGPSQQPHDDDDDDDDDYDDDETLTGRDSELQDEPRPSPAGKRTTSAGRSEDIRAIYKRYLLHATEYKRLQIKKIKLEIRKMEKDVSMNPNAQQKRSLYCI
ncbi:uncharacterized protein LOC120545684 isoform X3 [Perca fluviatilis]|uniref:uncharacterized protein LOC120545684 isoform X3 n=1 Tax=Perca fluviatilis TaxID=8168 RepID=UPI001962EBD9|nr:uncharacterized protein LOC120545684 isoform X3 [Perca fluviatilis]